MTLHDEELLQMEGVPAMFSFTDPDGNGLVYLEDADEANLGDDRSAGLNGDEAMTRADPQPLDTTFTARLSKGPSCGHLDLCPATWHRRVRASPQDFTATGDPVSWPLAGR
jgi:hypothetical protein